MWQLLWVYAMAASPELHECCHEHSRAPSHECVVDLTSDPPQVVVLLPVKNPGDGIGSACRILADAPPRGP